MVVHEFFMAFGGVAFALIGGIAFHHGAAHMIDRVLPEFGLQKILIALFTGMDFNGNAARKSFVCKLEKLQNLLGSDGAGKVDSGAHTHSSNFQVDFIILDGSKEVNREPFEFGLTEFARQDIIKAEIAYLEGNMQPTCDLHIHSVFSDGTCTPGELIALAEEAGLSAAALCDHNTVAGLPLFLEAARGSTVEAVPGIEFSSGYLGRELHILGLFITPEHYVQVTELLDESLRRKERSNRDLIDALRMANIFLDYDQIKAGTPAGQVNRAVIGAEMMKLGYAETVQEAISKWLSPERGYYHPPERPDAFQVISFIKSIGAVAVLAHPFLNLDEQQLRVFLGEAKKAGLDGMETRYPLFDERETELACAIADEFGLLHSGGSDFHGGNKPDIHLGTGKGTLRVPLTMLELLRMRASG